MILENCLNKAIVGKVAREIMDNGGINRDKEYKKMLHILPKYFKLGNSLQKEDMKNINKIIKIIYKGHGDDEPERLSEYAVKWILLNQNVIEIISPTYTR